MTLLFLALKEQGTRPGCKMKKKVKKMIDGVTEYVEATVSIFFEPNHVACNFCPLLETYARNQCRRTGEYIIDPRFTVGRYCPLNFVEKENS